LQDSQEEAKVEAFETLKIFQGERKSENSRGSIATIKSAREARSRPLNLRPGYRRREHRRKKSRSSDLVQGADSHQIQEKVHEV
jgi:hypothetical protein